MRKFILAVFVIALVIVAYETFRPQPDFPATNASLAGAATVLLGQ